MRCASPCGMGEHLAGRHARRDRHPDARGVSRAPDEVAAREVPLQRPALEVVGDVVPVALSHVGSKRAGAAAGTCEAQRGAQVLHTLIGPPTPEEAENSSLTSGERSSASWSAR